MLVTPASLHASLAQIQYRPSAFSSPPLLPNFRPELFSIGLSPLRRRNLSENLRFVLPVFPSQQSLSISLILLEPINLRFEPSVHIVKFYGNSWCRWIFPLISLCSWVFFSFCIAVGASFRWFSMVCAFLGDSPTQLSCLRIHQGIFNASRKFGVHASRKYVLNRIVGLQHCRLILWSSKCPFWICSFEWFVEEEILGKC